MFSFSFFSEEKDGEISDDTDEDCGDEIKPKTRKQRRKEKERKSDERKKMYLKNDMVRNFNRYCTVKCKPGGLDVETNRDRDRERP